MVKYVSTYTKGSLKIDQRDDAYVMFVDFSFVFLVFFIKAYFVGTHGQVDAIQMCIHNKCLYKEGDKKYTGCNLKTTELLDYVLIGVCAVIRSNTVHIFVWIQHG